MRYIARDPKLATTSDRINAMSRVSVLYHDPGETARRVVGAGAYPYMQFMYAGHENFPGIRDHRDYWTRWTDEFSLALERMYAAGDPRPKCVCIEHPRMPNRHGPGWHLFFEDRIDSLDEAMHPAAVLQFGVPSNSPVLYQLPMPESVIGLGRGDVDGVWLNIPGQNAFQGHATTRDEFRLGLAFAAAVKSDNVILWSDPAEDPSAHAMLQMPWVLEEIERMDPVSELPVNAFRPGETMSEYTARVLVPAGEAS